MAKPPAQPTAPANAKPSAKPKSPPPPPPLYARLPLSADDRQRFEAVTIRPAGPAGTTAADAMLIEGTISAGPGAASLLQLRPIFSGLMWFVAVLKPGEELPIPKQLTLVDDAIDPDVLRTFAGFEGRLIVQAASKDELGALTGHGTIPGVGIAPDLAYYEPVRIGFEFLQKSLLDSRLGLAQSPILEGKTSHKVGSGRWQQLRIAGFLNGTHAPRLRSNAKLERDDAATIPMPELVLDQRQLTLRIDLGWPFAKGDVPLDAIDPQFESIPAQVFMQQVARKLREDVLADQGADALTQAIIEDRTSAQSWVDDLKARLGLLGFGSVTGATDLENTLREFQIAASGTRIAKPVPPGPEGPALPERDFRGLQSVANPEVYASPISGRASRRTRALIDLWEAQDLRSPLVIPALTMAPRSEVPTNPPLVGRGDIWEREELLEKGPRFFAADFSQSDPAEGRIGLADLDVLGYCVTKKGKGPNAMPPSPARHDTSIEMLPESCLGVSEARLLAAIAKDDKENADYGLASTFRIIRSAAECENQGFMAIVSAYDGAGVSFGPCHWCIAGGQGNPDGATALGGVAAYFGWLAQNENRPDPFRRFGLAAFAGDAGKPGDAWSIDRLVANVGSGRDHLAALGYLDDRGDARAMNSRDVRLNMASWRTVYRWIHLARTDDDFNKACFDMTVRRLEAILSTPLGVAIGANRRPSIGAMFSTELLAAKILRWHIKSPDGVVVRDRENPDVPFRASNYIQRACQAAQKMVNPESWEMNLGVALEVELKAFIKAKKSQKSPADHSELPGQWDRITKAAWTNGKNPLGYKLHPLLRRLNGPWKLAPVKPKT